MDHEKKIIENHLFSDTSRYQDIIDLPRHVSKAHLPISRHDRAGQFAPFSALTGYHQLIDKTAERYQNRQYPTKEQSIQIHGTLKRLNGQSSVEINYFNSNSGYYETITVSFMKVDWQRGRAKFSDAVDPQKNYSIPIANIRGIRNLPSKK